MLPDRAGEPKERRDVVAQFQELAEPAWKPFAQPPEPPGHIARPGRTSGWADHTDAVALRRQAIGDRGYVDTHPVGCEHTVVVDDIEWICGSDQIRAVLQRLLATVAFAPLFERILFLVEHRLDHPDGFEALRCVRGVVLAVMMGCKSFLVTIVPAIITSRVARQSPLARIRSTARIEVLAPRARPAARRVHVSTSTRDVDAARPLAGVSSLWKPLCPLLSVIRCETNRSGVPQSLPLGKPF